MLGPCSPIIVVHVICGSRAMEIVGYFVSRGKLKLNEVHKFSQIYKIKTFSLPTSSRFANDNEIFRHAL